MDRFKDTKYGLHRFVVVDEDGHEGSIFACSLDCAQVAAEVHEMTLAPDGDMGDDGVDELTHCDGGDCGWDEPDEPDPDLLECPRCGVLALAEEDRCGACGAELRWP